LLNVTLDSLRREEQFAFGSLMPRKWELAFVTIEIIAGHTQAPGGFINAEKFIVILRSLYGRGDTGKCYGLDGRQFPDQRW